MMLRNLVVAMAMVLAVIGGTAYAGDASALDECDGPLCHTLEVDPCADPNATLNWKQCGPGDGSSSTGAEADSPDHAAGHESGPDAPTEEPGPRPDPCTRCLNWKMIYTDTPAVV